MGAFTGGGLSLVDQGMVPFQKAYLMIISMMFVILAGNHALPIFLRWVGSRVAREGTEAEQAFSFLLDHPRRCFYYLHQTWFLVICLVMFSATLAEAYESLSIWSTDNLRSIPMISRPSFWVFNSTTCVSRTCTTVSIRRHDVYCLFTRYEEQSLGVFEQPPEDEDEEPQSQDLKGLAVGQRVHRYLGWHLKKQTTVDIWWLVWGVFIITIIERNNLIDPDKKWFDLFRVLFELVSAFGGIGLSLGVPYDNFSFVGAMRPLSKLVVIVIMWGPGQTPRFTGSSRPGCYATS
ncbi:hypothetical protein MPER_11924 [Moniliophthora perniciosa FA553]|nr:hypothetical protein MPER_11924 [Moniliophthora perniciosa FA553]